MKGEFDSPSKPATDAYRDGWQRTFQDGVSYRTQPPAPVKMYDFSGPLSQADGHAPPEEE